MATIVDYHVWSRFSPTTRLADKHVVTLTGTDALSRGREIAATGTDTIPFAGDRPLDVTAVDVERRDQQLLARYRADGHRLILDSGSLNSLPTRIGKDRDVLGTRYVVCRNEHRITGERWRKESFRSLAEAQHRANILAKSPVVFDGSDVWRVPKVEVQRVVVRRIAHFERNQSLARTL